MTSVSSAPDSGVLYIAVLLAHVVIGFLGFAANLFTLLKADAFVRKPKDRSVSTYFDGRTNLPSRIIVLVPVFGILVALLGHQGADFKAAWFQAAVVIWLVLSIGCYLLVWPLEGAIAASLEGRLGASDPLKVRVRRANMFGYVMVMGYGVAFYLMLFKP